MELKMKGKFDLKKLASMPNFYFPVVNHSDDKVAFFWDKTKEMEMYVMDLVTKEIKQVTKGNGPKELRTSYTWTRDNKKLLFGKDSGGNEQHDLFSLDLETAELFQITDTPEHQEHIGDTSPDGEWIIFTSNRNGQMNLYKTRLDGSETIQLTAHEHPVFGGRYSSDGKFIAYTCNEEADLKNLDVYIVSSDGETVEKVISTKVGARDTFGTWAKDGKHFTFTTDSDGVAKAGIYNINTKEIKYFGDGKHEINAGRISDDGKYFSCTEIKNGSISLVVFDLEKEQRLPINFPPGVAAGTRFISNDKILVLLNSPTSPSSLGIFDIHTNQMEIIIDVDTGDIDRKYFIDSQHIFYESFDGLKIPAIIYKPRNFDPTKKYPGIVHAHGGPTAQFFTVFSIISQYFADLGYVVIEPNVRGSTGYGKEFLEMNLHDLGGGDLEDWKMARNYLVNELSVDENRVGIFGGSYGGYATLIAMTKSPSLWNAGVASVPISHWGNLYNSSMEHFKYYCKMLMGDPIENKDLWEDRSPLNYASQVENPILLTHGVNDPRCPVSESRNFIEAMEKSGKTKGPDGDFEYIEYDEIGHGSAGIDYRIKQLHNIFEFFERRL